MFGAIRLSVFRPGQAAGDAATVRPLVGLQKFLHFDEVIRGEQFVEFRRGQVERIVAFEPGTQFGRDREAVDERVTRRRRVFFFHFLDDRGVTLGENIKGELAHRLRPRGRGCNSRDELQRSGGGLRGSGAGGGKARHEKTASKVRCFAHPGIVADCRGARKRNCRSSSDWRTAARVDQRP